MFGSKRPPSWWWKAVVVLVLGATVILLPGLLILLLSVALVATGITVYRLAHRPGEGSRLRPWAAPFLWIMLSPLVTVPLSGLAFAFLVGTHSASEVHLPDVHTGWFSGPTRYFEFSPTVLIFTIPGIVNVAAFAWFFSRDGRVRTAAVVAGSLGLIRAGLPAVVLLAGFHQLTNPAGTAYSQYDSAFHPAPYIDVWAVSAVAWLLSLIVWGLFEKGTPGLIPPERLAWAVGALALVAAAGGIVYAAGEWQHENRVLHMRGYDIRESDWRIAARLWATSAAWGPPCEVVSPLSEQLALAAQSPDDRVGSAAYLTGKDWDTFFGRQVLTLVEGQKASQEDLQNATEILRDECRKRRPLDVLRHWIPIPRRLAKSSF